MSTIASSPMYGRSHALTVQKILLACGIVSSLVYVAANVVAGLSWPGYSFAAQTISELSAIGAPSRFVWIPFGIVYDILLIMFGVGVWRAAGPHRGLRIASAMLIAIATIGAAWPPMHMRGEVGTLTDTLHVVWASMISLFILTAVATGSTAGPRWFRNYSLATIAGMVVFASLTFRYAHDLAGNRPTPWLGVVERINLALYLIWVGVLARVLADQRSDFDRNTADSDAAGVAS